jgi:hypothetical protein
VATRTEVLLVDDLDGSTATASTAFALDGQGYEIDLNPAHDDELRDILARYIAVARRTQAPGRNGRGRGRARGAGRDQIDALAAEHRLRVRAWAQANPETLDAAGVPKVSDRGRLSPRVVALYDEIVRGGGS